MKPILDISTKGSFTVWESCVWREAFSSSVLVAGPDTSKLNVIYDKDPTRSSTHSLFYANVNNVLAGCFISKRDSRRSLDSVRVELMRIEGLTTKLVQDQNVPNAALVPIFLASVPMIVEYDKEPDFKTLLKTWSDRPSLPNARELMENAIRKAMTPPEQQKLFWGVPRPRTED